MRRLDLLRPAGDALKLAGIGALWLLSVPLFATAALGARIGETFNPER